MFTLCEACLCELSLSEVFSSLVSLAVPPTGGKKRGGGGGGLGNWFIFTISYIMFCVSVIEEP